MSSADPEELPVRTILVFAAALAVIAAAILAIGGIVYSFSTPSDPSEDPAANASTGETDDRSGENGSDRAGNETAGNASNVMDDHAIDRDSIRSP